jgi:hypothetical protein|tara:strand:+ start:447 stop:578 length:132 start_codon:yes stop_codon:yes gene_type:complete
MGIEGKDPELPDSKDCKDGQDCRFSDKEISPLSQEQILPLNQL